MLNICDIYCHFKMPAFLKRFLGLAYVTVK